MKKKILIAVGSLNPVKVKAVRKAFAKYFKNISVVSLKVKSGVSHQPMSFEEAYGGALNRARNSLVQYSEAEYAVGLEGTLQQYSFGWTTAGLAIILDKSGKTGLGISSQMQIPGGIVKKIGRSELGEVIAKISGQKNIKREGGAFGFFTNDQVTREEAYIQALIFALSRFINPKLYESC